MSLIVIDKYFPYQAIVDFINNSFEKDSIAYRDIGIVLKRNNENTYVRNRSIQDAEHLRLLLQEELPQDNAVVSEIHLGPLYKFKVPDNRQNEHQAKIGKELTLDIDITSYDDTRICCQERNCCNNCWKIIMSTSKVLDTILRESFQFSNITWVFSGRRGVHCWIRDKSILKSDDVCRAAISASLSHKTDLTYPLFNSWELPEFMKITWILMLKEFEENIIHEYNNISIKKTIEKIVSRPKYSFFEELKSNINNWSVLECWKYLKESTNEYGEKSGLQCNPMHEIVVYHIWPRLDTEVTTKLSHLLKLPFSIHSSTGNVSIPFNINTVKGLNDLIINVKNISEEINLQKFRESITLLHNK